MTDDAEVDGVSDVDMITPDFRPVDTGEPVSIAGMKGRTRRYVARLPDGTEHPAAGFALSRQCDLFVAASQGPAAESRASLHGIAGLLEQAAVRRWISVVLSG